MLCYLFSFLSIFFFLSPNKENDFSLGYCKNSQRSFSLNSYFFQFRSAHIDRLIWRILLNILFGFPWWSEAEHQRLEDIFSVNSQSCPPDFWLLLWFLRQIFHSSTAIHSIRILQARVLEWGAIAFSEGEVLGSYIYFISYLKRWRVQILLFSPLYYFYNVFMFVYLFCVQAFI